ncbi:MAG: polyprenol monophosphomannose synthase [Nanoarchaeota archaeon]
MQKNISVILPTYNEGMNIAEMINGINSNIKNLREIIVVDDNSPDGTGLKAKRMKNTRVIIRKKERGVGSAVYRGIKAAKGDIIAWMDCDLSMPPEALARMIESLDIYDVAVGSRYAPGGRDKRDALRVITSRAINLMANFVLNFKVKDYGSGFVATKKSVLEKVIFDPKGHGEYCIEFLYKCTRKNLKIREVGYVFEDRKKGTSKSNESLFKFLKFGVQYALRILRIRMVNP